MANPVTLNIRLSRAFVHELTGILTTGPVKNDQKGPLKSGYVYALYNQPGGVGKGLPMTTIINNGQLTGGTWASDGTYVVPITLTTDSVSQYVVAGTVQLIVQSDNGGSSHYNLTQFAKGPPTNAWTAQALNFGFDTFEVTLTNDASDVADISTINQFSRQLSLVANGDSRGYKRSTMGTDQLINDAASLYGSKPSPVVMYSGGPLKGTPQITWTPTGTVGQPPVQSPIPTSSAADPPTVPYPTVPTTWASADWTSFVTNFIKLDGKKPESLSLVTLSGWFNGACDAGGVWHNGAYYAYSVTEMALPGGSYGPAGDYFILWPQPSSQTKGYLVISAADLQSSLYQPGAPAKVSIYWNVELVYQFFVAGTSAANPMGTAANNQWGEIFTQLFTGFSGGYYGGVGGALNPKQANVAIDLNKNINWDPTYAFDQQRVPGSIAKSVIPSTAQHYDRYGQVFFADADAYGAAYSDALTAEFTRTPQISVWNAKEGRNVETIDLYAYARDETASPATYKPNFIANYLKPEPEGSDYGVAQPSHKTNSNELTLNLAIQGEILDQANVRARVVLGLYTGKGIFQYLTLPQAPDSRSSTGTSIWQLYQIKGKTAGDYTISWSNQTKPTGSVLITNLPTASAGVGWYQLIVGSKTFNFYTAVSKGLFSTTGLAIDGLATIMTPANAGSTTNQLTVDLMPGTMNTIDPSLLIADTTKDYIESLTTTVTAPVIGLYSGTGSFIPVPGQTACIQPTAKPITKPSGIPVIAFGWTGLNNDPNTPSWISGPTNKITALDTAQVTITKDGVTVIVATGQADLDGQWHTGAVVLPNGTYTATVTDVRPDGTVYGAVSSPLTFTIAMPSKSAVARPRFFDPAD